MESYWKERSKEMNGSNSKKKEKPKKENRIEAGILKMKQNVGKPGKEAEKYKRHEIF